MLSEISELIAVELVRGAEESIWKQMKKSHQGSFVATDSSLNSSLELVTSPDKGLHVTRFISNGTEAIPGMFFMIEGEISPWYAQLVPTLLFKNETSQEGEIWRVVAVRERNEEVDAGVLDEFCPTDVDQLSYAGLPLNEVVFWHEKGLVELPAWRVSMKATGSEEKDRLVVQD